MVVSAQGAHTKGVQAAAMVVTVKTTIDAVGGMEAVSKGLNSLLEGSGNFIKALDEVAKLHPFVGG